MNDEDSFTMPKSQPWNAPEHHNRQFSLAQARKMDYFSLGVVCVWVMFEKYLSGLQKLPQGIQWVQCYITQCAVEPRSYGVLESIKKENKLLQLAIQLTLGDTELEPDQKQALHHIFRGTLPYDPSMRLDNLGALFGFLPSDGYVLLYCFVTLWLKSPKNEHASFGT